MGKFRFHANIVETKVNSSVPTSIQEPEIITIIKEIPVEVEKLVHIVKEIEVIKEVQVFVDKLIHIEVPGPERIVEVEKLVHVEVPVVQNVEVIKEVIKEVHIPEIVLNNVTPLYIKVILVLETLLLVSLLINIVK